MEWRGYKWAVTHADAYVHLYGMIVIFFDILCMDVTATALAFNSIPSRAGRVRRALRLRSHQGHPKKANNNNKLIKLPSTKKLHLSKKSKKSHLLPIFWTCLTYLEHIELLLHWMRSFFGEILVAQFGGKYARNHEEDKHLRVEKL